jgi:hypothetical protein
MRKRHPYLPVLLALLLLASSCAGLDNSQVRLNEEFYLSMGQRALIAEEDLEIRFSEVTEDSRCPTDVTCVWPGRVTSKVEITRAGVSHEVLLTEPGLQDEYSIERHETYELSFHITPYPEAGEEITADEYRLYLIINRLSEPTEIIASIIADPFAFEGQHVTTVGYYRGWDLLHEANTPPPVTRSDWVIKDLTGAIYVSAHSEARAPKRLNPSSMQDTSTMLEVDGIVRVNKERQPYIEATSIRRVP